VIRFGMKSYLFLERLNGDCQIESEEEVLAESWDKIISDNRIGFFRILLNVKLILGFVSLTCGIKFFPWLGVLE